MNVRGSKETELGLIPEDWELKTLSDIVNVNPKRPIKKGTEVKFVAMSDVKEFNKKIQDFTLREYSGGARFQNDDTIVARITPSLENGKTSYVDILEENEIAAGSTEFIVLSAKEEKTTPQFTYYLAISSKVRELLIKSMTGTSGRQRVDNDVFNQIEIPVPPIEEQESIADFLNSIDKKIENNQKMNQNLEKIGQAIFKQWFVHFEFSNEEGKPYKSNDGKMVDSEIGKIPKEWKIAPLSDCISKIVDNRGKTPPLSDNGRKLLETYQVFLDKPFPDFKKASKQKFVTEETYKNWFRSGHPEHLDLLFATVGTIPNWCLVPKNCDFCIAQNVIALRANKIISPFYLKFTFNTHYFLEQFNGRVIETVQPSIRVKHLMEIKIIKPPTELITAFDSLVKSFYDKIELNNKINDKLTEIRDSLLPKLMSGKIRVESGGMK